MARLWRRKCHLIRCCPSFSVRRKYTGEFEIESSSDDFMRNAVVQNNYHAPTFFAYTLFISFNSLAICSVSLALLCCDKTLHFTSFQSCGMRCHTLQSFGKWKRTAKQLKATQKCIKWKKKCATYFEQYGVNAKMMKPFVCLGAPYGSFVCVQCTYSCDNSFLSSFMKCSSELVWFRLAASLHARPAKVAVHEWDLLLFRIVCFFCECRVLCECECDLLKSFHGISLSVIRLRAFQIFSLIYVRDLMTAAVHSCSEMLTLFPKRTST